VHVKKLWYVMSVFPCLALLAALAVGRLVGSEAARRRTAALASAALVAIAALAAGTPIGTPRPRQPDLHELARVVRANVPPGQSVINLDTPYWDVAHHFRFYSDHDLTEPLGDPARVRERLRGGEWALIADRRVADVLDDGKSACVVVARSGRWALLTAEPAAPLVLQPADPR
jgi:hypothetical protein